MIDLLLACGCVFMLGLAFRILFVTIPDRRVARRSCPRCGGRLGVAAVSTAVPYYERLYGAGTRVRGGRRRYLGSRVVTCGGCGVELVFSEMGSLIEPFQELPRCS